MILVIALGRIRAWRPKVEETLLDVREGRLSFHAGEPIRVSRLDAPRGAFFVVDGHHRAVEAALRGDRTIRGIVDENVPRIERTAGATRSSSFPRLERIARRADLFLASCPRSGYS